MIIRQKESTPIGDYFHDSSILKVFEHIQNSVYEFEVDTTELSEYYDTLIISLKGLKGQIKKAESEWTKHKSQEKISDLIHNDLQQKVVKITLQTTKSGVIYYYCY